MATPLIDRPISGRHRASWAALLIFAFAAGSEKIWSLDIHWHLTAGRWILQHHALPAVDLWSSMGSGFITPTSWLFQVFAYSLFRIGGFPALSLLNGVALMLLGIILFLLTPERTRRTWGPILTIVILMLVQRRIRARPETVTLICTALTLLLIPRLRQKGVLSPILLALLFIIWANSHSMFPLGPAMLCLSTLAAWIAGEDRRALPILRALAISAAIFITPHPEAFLRIPLQLIPQISGSQRQFAAGFSELAPTAREWMDFQAIGFFGMTVLSGYFLWRARSREHISFLFLSVVGVLLGISPIRNAALGSLMLGYVVLQLAPPGQSRSGYGLVTAGLASILTLLYLSGGIGSITGRVARPGFGEQEDYYPTELARAIASVPGEAEILTMNFGSAAPFMFHQDDAPQHRLVIDGRSDIHGPQEYEWLFETRTRASVSVAEVERLELPPRVGFIVVDIADFDILENFVRAPSYHLWFLDRNHACFVRGDSAATSSNLSTYDLPLSGRAALLGPDRTYRRSFWNLQVPETHMRLGMCFGLLGEETLASRYLEAALRCKEGDPCDRYGMLALAHLAGAETSGPECQGLPLDIRRSRALFLFELMEGRGCDLRSVAGAWGQTLVEVGAAEDAISLARRVKDPALGSWLMGLEQLEGSSAGDADRGAARMLGLTGAENGVSLDAIAALRRGRPEPAERLPDSRQTTDLHALALCCRGRFEDAERLLERAPAAADSCANRYLTCIRRIVGGSGTPN